MAVIVCKVAEDGMLTSSQPQFEPGDTIQFESDVNVEVLGSVPVAIGVQRAFVLKELVGRPLNGTVQISFLGQGGPPKPAIGPQICLPMIPPPGPGH